MTSSTHTCVVWQATSEERVSRYDLDRNKKLLDELFDNGRVVYQGYVDDPRNTDHAWMETTAFHFHCSRDCARMLKLEAGDDAQSVRWIDIDAASDAYAALYAVGPHNSLWDPTPPYGTPTLPMGPQLAPWTAPS